MVLFLAMSFFTTRLRDDVHEHSGFLLREDVWRLIFSRLVHEGVGAGVSPVRGVAHHSRVGILERRLALLRPVPLGRLVDDANLHYGRWQGGCGGRWPPSGGI